MVFDDHTKHQEYSEQVTRDLTLSKSDTPGMSQYDTRSQCSPKETSFAGMADLANLKIDPETLEADFLTMVPPPPMERLAMRSFQRYPVIVHTRALGHKNNTAIAPPQNLDSRIERMRAIMRDYTLSAKERSRKVRNLTILAEQDFIEAVRTNKSEEDAAIDHKQAQEPENRVGLIRNDSCIHSRSFSRMPTITEDKAEDDRVLKISMPKNGSGQNLHMKVSNPSSPKPKSRIPVRRDPARISVSVKNEVRSGQETDFASIEAKLATLDAFFDVDP